MSIELNGRMQLPGSKRHQYKTDLSIASAPLIIFIVRVSTRVNEFLRVSSHAPTSQRRTQVALMLLFPCLEMSV
jgi:hypothetical protein